MKDICIDFCESTICIDCKYKDATKEEREKAYYEIENWEMKMNEPLRARRIDEQH